LISLPIFKLQKSLPRTSLSQPKRPLLAAQFPSLMTLLQVCQVIHETSLHRSPQRSRSCKMYRLRTQSKLKSLSPRVGRCSIMCRILSGGRII
jgi:hypothetical protein